MKHALDSVLMYFVFLIYLCVPISAVIYYRLTQRILLKFKDSFVKLDEQKIAVITTVYVFPLTFFISLSLQKIFPTIGNHQQVANFFWVVYYTLGIMLFWKLLQLKQGETESRLILMAYFIIAPIVALTLSTFICTSIFVAISMVIIVIMKT